MGSARIDRSAVKTRFLCREKDDVFFLAKN